MNVYFNDLTFPGQIGDMIACLPPFAALFSLFHRKTGETRVWAPQSIRSALFEAMAQLSPQQQMSAPWTLALGAFSLKSGKFPDEGEDVTRRFCEADFRIDTPNGTLKCGQMGLSVLTRPSGCRYSLTLGFAVDSFWAALLHEIRDVNARKTYKALCLTKPEHLDEDSVSEWCQYAYPVALPTSGLKPSEKRIHVRDDHGQDVLQLFAQRLVCSPYVVEIVNSLPMDSQASTFIESVSPNGIVNIRLHWTDRGLGLAVRTTARSHDDAQRIARQLADRFDKGR